MPLPASNEGDAFAIAMIVVMFSAFGVIAMIIVTIFRSAARRNREEGDLPEDGGNEEKKKTAATAKTEEPREPWERDGDWWKK